MFKALDAAPASLQFSEVYSALQTKVVDAQENPLPIIQVAKLYEVQKYCALTQPHLGRLLVHRQRPRLGRRCRPTCRRSSRDAINEAGMKQRDDIKTLNETGAGRSAGEGAGLQQDRSRTASAPSCARPASTRSGRSASAPRPGVCSKAPSASSPERSRAAKQHRRIRHGRPRRSHAAGSLPATGLARLADRLDRVIGGVVEARRGAARAGRDRHPRARASPRATSSTRRWSGRTSWPRSCSSGSRCWARSSRCGAASTCA